MSFVIKTTEQKKGGGKDLFGEAQGQGTGRGYIPFSYPGDLPMTGISMSIFSKQPGS